MRVYARTHTGKVRKGNEDAYYIPESGERFAIVADGMGGHLAGEVASRMAVEIVTSVLRGRQGSVEDALKQAILRANTEIYQAAQRDTSKIGMGTTLTALAFEENWVYLAHVGDSRAYLYRKGALMQLSRDHSLVGELLESGEITAEQARVHPHRNYITRALGTTSHVLPDLLRIDMRPGDVWLLCSDGLSNLVGDAEIAKILSQQHNPDEALDQLVALALDRGGKDNITVVIIFSKEDEQV